MPNQLRQRKLDSKDNAAQDKAEVVWGKTPGGEGTKQLHTV